MGSFRQVGASAAVLRARPSSGVAPQRLAACPSRTALPRRLGTVRLRAFARVRLRAVVRQDQTLASRRRRPARATLCLLWHRSASPHYARLRTRPTGGVVGRWVVHTFGRPAVSGRRRIYPPALRWCDACSRPVFTAHRPVYPTSRRPRPVGGLFAALPLVSTPSPRSPAPTPRWPVPLRYSPCRPFALCRLLRRYLRCTFVTILRRASPAGMHPRRCPRRGVHRSVYPCRGTAPLASCRRARTRSETQSASY